MIFSALIEFIHIIIEKINPLNVAKLLFEEISAKYSKSTSINNREIELKDNLLGNFYFGISYVLYTNIL
jgi:hypothetical protein